MHFSNIFEEANIVYINSLFTQRLLWNLLLHL